MSVTLHKGRPVDVDDAHGNGTTQRKAFLILGIVVLILVLLAAWRAQYNAREQPTGSKEQVLTVDTIDVRTQPMPVLLQAVGQVVPEHSVQLRPQISGVLKQVLFDEGQSVAVGQPLFRIEAAPFEAALASARAAWENAKGNAGRLQTLLGQGYVIPQDYSNARTMADQAEAAYRQAQINLSYTELRAPISGRTGRITVKAGNLVSPGDATQLVTINQMRPIQVQFNIPQQYLPAVRQHQAQNSIKVVIGRDSGGGVLDEGVLVFVDNTVNLSTGTVTLKGRLPNRREQLWPGQYVSVNMQLTVEARAVVIPQISVLTGQDGNYVYVVSEGRAKVRSVKVDRQVDDLAVISSGLVGGEKVVLRVPRNLRAGIRVTAAAEDAMPPAEVTLPNPQ